MLRDVKIAAVRANIKTFGPSRTLMETKFQLLKIFYVAPASLLTETSAHLAKKALMLMLRLVSGVTISVLVKSMLPSPGCGIGNPTPIPAAGAFETGTTGKVDPDGITT